MQKHEDVVQNLNGNVVVNATIQVMVAFTSTPATIYSDPAAQVPIDLLRTDSLGQFEFYAPNGRLDIFAIINGNRVAHALDVLLFDPEDDERITSAGSGGGSGGAGGGGSGGTSADQTEVVLTQASDGSLAINRTTGVNLTATLTANAKILNPVGYAAGDRIRIVLRQDATGNRLLTYDTQYAIPNAQPPALSTGANAVDQLMVEVTTGPNGLEYLLTPNFNNYAAVLAIARIGQAMYYKLAGADGAGAFNHIVPGNTAYILRNGKGLEATGAIQSASASDTFVIAGAPVNGQRPLLTMLPDTRPAYGKAVINFEGSLTATVRDLRITGARNSSNDARGIAMNDSGDSANPNTQHITVQNVEITDCNNGILTGNQGQIGSMIINDSRFDSNGVGGPNSDGSQGNNSSGYVHNIYMGHTKATLEINRSTFSRSITGHDIKTRADITHLNQVLATGSYQGRELNAPNGGKIYATNCTFWKTGDATQNNLISIGEEGMDTTRPTEYVFTNCRFQNDVVSGLFGKDVTFVTNFDTNARMTFIDCQFIGDSTEQNTVTPSSFPGMTTVGGIRFITGMDPIKTLTGGPIGPLLPVGYFPVDMTPVTG